MVIDQDDRIYCRAGSKDDLEVFTSTEFPELLELHMDFGKVVETGLVLKSAPKLSFLTLAHVKDMNFFKNTWNSLKKLYVQSCSGIFSLENAILPNLEILTIDVSSDRCGAAEINNCTFPKLLKLEVTGGDEANGFFENFVAPNLESFSSEMHIFNLDFSKSSSNLKSLNLWNVRSLRLGAPEKLKELNLRGDCLEDLTFDTRVSLKHLKEINADIWEYESWARHEDHDERYFEIIYKDEEPEWVSDLSSEEEGDDEED